LYEALPLTFSLSSKELGAILLMALVSLISHGV
jgi:hypothetical protein